MAVHLNPSCAVPGPLPVDYIWPKHFFEACCLSQILTLQLLQHSVQQVFLSVFLREVIEAVSQAVLQLWR